MYELRQGYGHTLRTHGAAVRLQARHVAVLGEPIVAPTSGSVKLLASKRDRQSKLLLFLFPIPRLAITHP